MGNSYVERVGEIIFKKPLIAVTTMLVSLDDKFLDGDKRKLKHIMKENRKFQEELFN